MKGWGKKRKEKNPTMHQTNPLVASVQDNRGLCLHTIDSNEAEQRNATSLSWHFYFLNPTYSNTWFQLKYRSPFR